MSQPRPTSEDIAAAIEVGEHAVTTARDTRKRLRGRRTPGRPKQLAAARERCAEAAVELRSYLGMAAWGGITVDDELAMKKTMSDLRYERRQIDKMKP